MPANIPTPESPSHYWRYCLTEAPDMCIIDFSRLEQLAVAAVLTRSFVPLRLYQCA